jgi:hypothetical protein
MKFSSKNILALFVVILQACTIDSNISERDYPVIKSLGIKDLNETGVNIDFMIIQNSSSTIESYGVQYRAIEKEGSANISIPEYFFYEEITGKPQGNPLSIRLQYDLIPGLSYFARPFVRSGSQMIFGESFNFSSLGVKGPEITSVSVSKFSQNHSLTIEGNFFSRKPEDNILDFSGLEEFFIFRIKEASPTKLEVDVEKKNNSLPDLDKIFNLKVTVNGKSGILNGAFKIDVPKILNAEPLVVSVNENINMEVNFVNDPGYFFVLNSQNGSSYLLSDSTISSNLVIGETPNVPPGKYKLALKRFGFEDYIFPQEITVKASWELVNENLPVIVEGRYSYLSAGNQIVTYNYEPFYDLYSFDLNNTIPSKIGDFPENGRKRERYALHYSDIDDKIYFGLGGKPASFENELILHRDFYRYDIQSKTSERLPDLPEGLTAVQWSFDYQGKLAIAFLFRPNFHFFNISQNTWEDTGVDVPFDLKDAVAVTSKNETIYFLRMSSNYQSIHLLSLQIGQSPVLIAQVPIYSDFPSNWDIIEFENSIFFGSSTKRIFEYKIASDQLRTLQSITDFNNKKAKFYKIGSDLFYGLPNFTTPDENRLFKFVR